MSNQNELHGKLVQVQYLLRGHLRRNVVNFDIMKGNLHITMPLLNFTKFDFLLILI